MLLVVHLNVMLSSVVGNLSDHLKFLGKLAFADCDAVLSGLLCEFLGYQGVIHIEILVAGTDLLILLLRSFGPFSST